MVTVPGTCGLAVMTRSFFLARRALNMTAPRSPSLRPLKLPTARIDTRPDGASICLTPALARSESRPCTPKPPTPNSPFLACYMTSESRAHYRVDVDAAEGLAVTMHSPGSSPFVGRLVDTSACGVGVCFSQPNWPNLTVGQEIDLVFFAEKFNKPLTVAVRVQNRTEEAGARRFGFRFLHAEQLDAHLSLTFREYFNRRKVVRTSPEPDHTAKVTLQAGEGRPPMEARLENFSASGAAVSLDAGLDAEFAETTTVGFSMQMPKCRRPVEMMGNIRYRRLIGARIHYGIEFDPETSEDFARQQDIINKYLTKMEKQWLRLSA